MQLKKHKLISNYRNKLHAWRKTSQQEELCFKAVSQQMKQNKTKKGRKYCTLKFSILSQRNHQRNCPKILHKANNLEEKLLQTSSKNIAITQFGYILHPLPRKVFSMKEAVKVSNVGHPPRKRYFIFAILLLDIKQYRCF